MNYSILVSYLHSGMERFIHICERFDWLAEASVFVSTPTIDAALSPAVDIIGDVTLIKYLICLFGAFFLGSLLRLVPSMPLKHLCSFSFGLIMVQWVFGPSWVHTLISASGTYLICLMCPRHMAGDIGFVWTMGYMTLSHAYRMYVAYNSSELDFTMMQMVLTMKLSSLAYNYSDGSAREQAAIQAGKTSDKRAVAAYNEQVRLHTPTPTPNPTLTLIAKKQIDCSEWL